MSVAAIELVRAASPRIHGATATAGWETGLAVAVATLLVVGALTIAALVLPHRRGQAGGEDADSGPGGGGPGRQGPDGPRGPEGDPVWWPEFERQFAAYVVCRTAGIA